MTLKTNKSIFYHIPRTGGSWVTEVFRRLGEEGGKFERPKRGYDKKSEAAYWGAFASQAILVGRGHETHWSIMPEEKEGLFSFAFVREPLSWYKSYWANCKKRSARISPYSGTHWRSRPLDFAWDNNFEEFIINALSMFREGALSTLGKCYFGVDGNALDFVGRQENLREDLIKALTLAGEDFDEKAIRNLEKINAASNDYSFKLTFKLSSKLEKELMRREKWIINTFYKQ